jgi:hypothetical protein
MTDIVDGMSIKMGGKEYIVPPLNFKQLRNLKTQIESLSGISGAPDGDQIEAVTQIVQAALSRNYPEITTDDVEGLIDLFNLRTIISAIMGISGLVASGEA